MEQSEIKLISLHYGKEKNNTQIARELIAAGNTQYKERAWRERIKEFREHHLGDYASQAESTYKESKDSAELSGIHESALEDSASIIDEFLASKKIDLRIWEVDRFTIGEHTVSSKHRDQDLEWNGAGLMEGHAIRKNSWVKTKNHSIKVWLKKKLKHAPTEGLMNMIKNISQIKIPTPPRFKFSESGIALELSVFDAHLGKLAWAQEIGRRNFDLKEAVKDYEYVVEQNLAWASLYKPEKIFYIVGQDLIHTDNNMGTTSRGSHVLDVDSRLFKIYETAFESVVKGIMMCRQMAPVEVIWIPGNHDEHTSFFLCHAIDKAFKDDPDVTVDLSKGTRKARVWGNLLVGWTHRIINRQEAWVNELAHAFPKLWAESKFREWHFGDQHKKKQIKHTPIFSAGGVTLRQLTALSEIDKWHYDNLFVDAIPGGEALLWSKEHGIFSNLTAWTKYESK